MLTVTSPSRRMEDKPYKVALAPGRCLCLFCKTHWINYGNNSFYSTKEYGYRHLYM